eukprot:TRINITY_DN804_c0_g1_i2.p1 TRINITY_DN804_c0_g1~~TRINITY_DN804_c0_g1_i2.p1  ORF type:complete len:269 (-),score=132.54 TRINITY_DN804_c0_g1_i2:751-1557(-)
MASQIGAQVKFIETDWESPVDKNRVLIEAQQFQPHLITIVHCDTPTGILNPIREIGQIAKAVGALYYVDFVSSGAATPISIDQLGIDLGMLGSQKALSLLPDSCIVTVSELGWKRICEVRYVGYEALLPFGDAIKNKFFPATPNWHSIAAIEQKMNELEEEGFDNVYARHLDIAFKCRQRLIQIGLELFIKDENSRSPSVTSVCIPQQWTWEKLNAAFRAEGLVVGGSYGKTAGKLFRIGHMGIQANEQLIMQACDIIEKVIKTNPIN